MGPWARPEGKPSVITRAGELFPQDSGREKQKRLQAAKIWGVERRGMFLPGQWPNGIQELMCKERFG